LIDVLQPCVSFNKVNTFSWYKNRCYQLSPDHDPSDWNAALDVAFEWGEKIPIGVIYQSSRPVFGARSVANLQKQKEMESSIAEILKQRMSIYW